MRIAAHQFSTQAEWLQVEPVVVAEPASGAAELRKQDQDYLVLHPGGFEAVFRPARSLLEVWPEPNSDSTTREHLLLDQLLPRVMAHQGHLLLHASAVLIDDRAVCFVAASGVGKSTLAAMLSAHGCPLLADDVIRIGITADGVLVHPGYASLRLWQDSTSIVQTRQIVSVAAMADYSSKHVFLLRASECHAASSPLGALVLLAEDAPDRDTPLIRKLAPAAALIRLMGQSFSLHPGLASVESMRLRGMAGVCTLAHPVELGYRRDYAGVVELLDCLKRVAAPA